MQYSGAGDRATVHYTMKTSSRSSPASAGGSHSHSRSHSQSHSHSHSHSHSLGHSKSGRSSRNTKSTTPLASPRTPYSVGQNHPPKLSPGRSPEARAPSPNYFGLVIDCPNDPRDSSGPVKDGWTPSPSSVKSFAAAIPKQVTLDANPEFEAFRRQADLNRGKTLAPSTSHYITPPTSKNPAPVRPRPPPRWHTHASDTGSSALRRERPASRMDIDPPEGIHDSAYVSAESKRNSESSLKPPQITSQQRFASPMPMDPRDYRTSLTRSEDRDPRLSVMEHKLDPPSPQPSQAKRPVTVSPTLDKSAPNMISGARLIELLETVNRERLLLLDIRSSQNYSHSRIDSALNLCIPTTLLKRPSFNIDKLQQTFQNGNGSEKFARWKDMEWIVVYDAHSSDKRDAVTAQNMIKKFTNEGFSGRTSILRGGFSVFHNMHPEYVDSRSAAEITRGSSGTGPSEGLAPVIGGVNLPTATNEPNPFFSNIRQNMDLADGVGQFEVAKPRGLDLALLPKWLRDAAAEFDNGKKVSNKFLNIEVDEQARMKGAYAAFKTDNVMGQSSKVQLCGVEKGVKNRYKDILPFEHARVKLQDKPHGSCDYVNASHLKASRSNKRYIATQGPLPATFEDFWSVVWEQDVRVIVMLTAESEGGQLKCHPYWKDREFGPLKLRPLSEKKASLDIDKHRSSSTATPSSFGFGEFGRRRANTTTTMDSSPSTQPPPTQSDVPYVIIRKFALTHTSHPFAPIREITHLHFPSWPDFGTPAQPSHLLALVELANVMQRAALPVDSPAVVGSRRTSAAESLSISWYDEPESEAKSRPMLVHCSAGCGRTGTFCTVDSVIDMLKRQRQAKLEGIRTRDAEGDVSMMDLDEAVSPRTVDKRMHLDLGERRLSIEKPTRTPSSSLETGWIPDDNLDLIQKTVEDFRGQRLSMVQSLRQYVLCYETVLEWLARMTDRSGNAISGRARSGSLQHQVFER